MTDVNLEGFSMIKLSEQNKFVTIDGVKVQTKANNVGKVLISTEFSPGTTCPPDYQPQYASHMINETSLGGRK